MFVEMVATKTVAELIEFTPQQLIGEVVSLQASLYNTSKTLDEALANTDRLRKLMIDLVETSANKEASLITAAIDTSMLDVWDYGED